MAITDQHATAQDAALNGASAIVPLPQALGERIDVHPTVQSLRPLMIAAESQIEQDRRLPDELVAALDTAGLFLGSHPREYGGIELHPLDNQEFVFELARINGSVAWIAVIQSGNGYLVAPDVMEELREQGGGRFISSGSHGRIGKAYPVEGGYRFTGQWAFASGSLWATHTSAYAYVMGEDDQPLKDPYTGGPMYVDGIFPTDRVNFIPNSWNSLGLRGTGSGQFTLEDAFLERRFVGGMTDVAYQDRALFNGGYMDAMPLVALGVAQGAIDRFIELSHAKRRKNSWGNRANSLGQEQLHQVRVAHADALIRGARAWGAQIANEGYEGAFDKDAQARYDNLVAYMQWGVYCGRIAKEAMNLIFDIAGTDSVIEGRGIERCFRDVHTATQHTLVLENNYTALGQYYLTRDLPDGPIITVPDALLPPAPPKPELARLWQLDHLHSSVGFRVTHHAVGSFRGYFEQFSAAYDADAGSITGSAQVASVKVFEMLREHLLGDDFLAAAAHPEVSFASTSVVIDGDAVTVQGDLTLKGVTKPVTATGAIVGPSRDRGFGADSEFVGMDIEITIDRREFGIEFNNELLDGQLNLGWDVTLDFSLEFTRPVAEG